MTAENWSEDLAHHHESFDFCVIDDVRGERGPHNQYRRWSYEAQEGDVLLFEPGEYHRASGGPVASYRVFLLAPQLLSRAADELTCRSGSIHWKQAVARDAYPHFVRLAALANDVAVPPLALQEALVFAVQHVVARCAERARSTAAPEAGRTIARTLEYIDAFLKDSPDCHLTLDDVVSYSGASSKYELCRAFKAATRSTIYANFKARKLGAAARALIAQPRRPIQHVAWDFGYTPQCFVRAFREFFGVSPRAYRAGISR